MTANEHEQSQMDMESNGSSNPEKRFVFIRAHSRLKFFLQLAAQKRSNLLQIFPGFSLLVGRA
jgi:hypothetical protein